MREMLDESVVRNIAPNPIDALAEVGSVIRERIPFMILVGKDRGGAELVSIQHDGGITEQRQRRFCMRSSECGEVRASETGRKKCGDRIAFESGEMIVAIEGERGAIGQEHQIGGVGEIDQIAGLESDDRVADPRGGNRRCVENLAVRIRIQRINVITTFHDLASVSD